MRILLRGGTAAEWSNANPTLAAREVGVETDTRKIKVGDGTTAWNSLGYLSAAATGVLDDLTDVTITSAASGDILRYNGTAWVDAVGTTYFEAAGAVAAHEADTTSVHGIADTSTLYRSGGTDVAVADGGTGASNASGARTNLGLVIGTDVQAYDADLAAIAAITPSQGDVIYHNGTSWVRLAAGTSGQFLQTSGAGANPLWATPTSITTPAANALTGSPTLKFWYKADDVSGSDGASVSAWSDASASGYNLSQGTGSKQPVVKTAVPWFNGHRAVRFDGTDDTINNTSTGSSAMASCTAFAVCASAVHGAARSVLDARGSSTYLDIIKGGGNWSFYTGPATGATDQYNPLRGAWVVIVVTDGTDGWMYINGVLAAYGAVGGSVTPTSIYVGSNADVNQYWIGDIAEVGAYSTALSVAQIKELNNGLSNKYGVGSVML